MAIEALCPTCGAVFNLKDEFEGKKVRCKKCEQIFTVNGSKAEARDDDRGVKTKADGPAKRSSRDDDEDDDRVSRKGRAAAKRGRDDDEDDDRPKRKSSRRGRDDDDDDDDKPRGRKRTYHDDDDDDDRPRRRPAKSGGGAGKVIAIVGGIIALVLLLCGGAIYGIVRLADSADDALADAAQQAQQNAANGGGGFGGAGGNPFMGFPGNERQPADMAEALKMLKGNDPGDRRGAANWLANQPVDAAKQKEVGAALDGLVKDSDDNTCVAGAKALKVWGTLDDGPALTQALKSRLPAQNRPFLNEDQKQLMGAIAHVKYVPGAEVICEFLPNFFCGGEAESALGTFGPTAEPAVLKWYNHPDGNGRGKARGLCVRYGTKPLTILDQTVIDLGSPDRNRTGAALEWLAQSTLASNEALAAAKNDPARRASVGKALNNVLSDTQANADQCLGAAKRWATKDNVPALVNRLETDPWKKKDYADVLITIGSDPANRAAVETPVKGMLSHRDGNVVNEAKRILKAVGGADAQFDALIADLKSGDNRRIQEAARELARSPVSDKQRPAVVGALLDAVNGDGFFQGNDPVEAIGRAIAVWAAKDDAPGVVDKFSQLKKPFLNRARKVVIEWLGKVKAEKGITFLTSLLPERDEYQDASKALQAMGPELGAKIEEGIGLVVAQITDQNQLAEVYRILGAVGTQNSLAALKRDQLAWTQKKNFALAMAAQQAATAIQARGK